MYHPRSLRHIADCPQTGRRADWYIIFTVFLCIFFPFFSRLFPPFFFPFFPFFPASLHQLLHATSPVHVLASALPLAASHRVMGAALAIVRNANPAKTHDTFWMHHKERGTR